MENNLNSRSTYLLVLVLSTISQFSSVNCSCHGTAEVQTVLYSEQDFLTMLNKKVELNNTTNEKFEHVQLHDMSKLYLLMKANLLTADYDMS